MKYGEVSKLDEVTGDVVVDGVPRRRELWREVLHKGGGWAVVVLGVQEKTPRGWGPEKVSISKWRFVAQRWVRHSSIIEHRDRWIQMLMAIAKRPPA